MATIAKKDELESYIIPKKKAVPVVSETSEVVTEKEESSRGRSEGSTCSNILASRSEARSDKRSSHSREDKGSKCPRRNERRDEKRSEHEGRMERSKDNSHEECHHLHYQSSHCQLSSLRDRPTTSHEWCQQSPAFRR